MGLDVSNVTNKTVLEQINKQLMNFNTKIQNKFNVKTKQEISAINNVDYVIKGSKVGSIKISQDIIQSSLIDIANTCKSAITQASTLQQKNDIKADLINEVKKQVGLLGAAVSNTTNNLEQKQLNEIIMNFQDEFITEINNEFKNIQRFENRVKMIIEDAEVGNIDISQKGKQDTSGKQTSDVSNESTKTADVSQGSTSEVKQKNSLSVSTGFTIGMLGIVAVVVIVAVIFASKTARDPNLGKNAEQIGKAVKDVKSPVGGFMNYLGGVKNYQIVVKIIIFLVLIITITIVFNVIKNKIILKNIKEEQYVMGY